MDLIEVPATGAPVVTTAEPDVRALAKALLEEHNGIAEAAAALEVMAEEDTLLYRTIVNGHFHRMCSQLVMSVAAGARKRSDAPPPERREDFAGHAAQVAMSLMDYPIYGGRRLGDCNKAELVTGSNGYRTQADDMLTKSRWLKLVADKMPEGSKTVRQVLKENVLADLRQQARDAARAQ